MENRNNRIRLIIAAAAVILAFFIVVSVCNLISLNSSMSKLYGYANIIKRLVPFLCMSIVFLIGKDGLGKKDIFILKLSFCAICMGELGFLAGKFIPGIAFFAACHILLSIRHYSWLSESFSSGRARKHLAPMISSGLAILLVMSLWISLIFYPALKANTVFYVLIIYGLILGTSLWMAIINCFAGSIPKRNAVFIMIAVILIFFSDFMVGVFIITTDKFARIIIDQVIWITYVPAGILLALSGYKCPEMIYARKPC